MGLFTQRNTRDLAKLTDNIAVMFDSGSHRASHYFYSRISQITSQAFSVFYAEKKSQHRG